jgi:Spy/CpxP family protein refolding chaperone
MKRSMMIAAMLVACSAVWAQPMPAPAPHPPGPPDQDPIANQLFPPELIMGHQDELQLQEKQRAAIRAEVVNLQTHVVDLQWQLSEAAERLAALLRGTPIDEAKALEQADKVMSLEREIKRLHLGTLIRIKNTLTPEQIARLRQLRPRNP